jgi:hypothetical protein
MDIPTGVVAGCGCGDPLSGFMAASAAAILMLARFRIVVTGRF